MSTQLNAERGLPFILIGGTLVPWAVEAVGGGSWDFEERSTGGALTLTNRDPRIVCDGIADNRCQTA
jgi:hypothetical protein